MSDNFNFIVNQLSEKLKNGLPGSLAHEPLRAMPAQGNSDLKFEHTLPPRLSSVLILLFEENKTIKFPLIKRPIYLGAHSGQVSLPGGKSEAGEDYITTALRETYEEVGIVQTEINVIGRLSEFYVIPSNFMVTPVVGFLRNPGNFIPDAFEVEKIIFGTLNDLLKADAVQEKEIVVAGKYPIIAPHFVIEKEIVWGATAMMLNEFRLILKQMI